MPGSRGAGAGRGWAVAAVRARSVAWAGWRGCRWRGPGRSHARGRPLKGLQALLHHVLLLQLGRLILLMSLPRLRIKLASFSELSSKAQPSCHVLAGCRLRRRGGVGAGLLLPPTRPTAAPCSLLCALAPCLSFPTQLCLGLPEPLKLQQLWRDHTREGVCLS